jgi:hypothetical protein
MTVFPLESLELSDEEQALPNQEAGSGKSAPV